MHLGWQEFVVASLAFSICVVMVLLRKRFPRLSGRTDDLRAVQSAHTRVTPRMGGVAIFGALCLTVVLAPVVITAPSAKFILATSLLFFVGLAEDLGFRVSPRGRFLAAVGASLLAIWFLKVWLPRTGVPGLDVLVDHGIVGIPLTLLLTAGIANGFNLIDGVNGLASLTAMVAGSR